MKRLHFLFCFLLLPFYLLFAQPGKEFVPACELPFKSIATEHPVDDKCGTEGQGTKKNAAANKLQNAAKNNFCATGAVKNVKVKDLVELHKKVQEMGITYGTYLKVPEDRSGLQQLGEGTRVRFTGYINDVKYANLTDGEGVNCKGKGAENNDIHIELTEKKNEKEKCKRVSAEISPHFRPLEWNVSKLTKVESNHIKIRLTGQLFFDASHGSCIDSKKSGYRGSSWEIHPVYRIEVYIDEKWIDLHEWDDSTLDFPHEDEEK